MPYGEYDRKIKDVANWPKTSRIALDCMCKHIQYTKDKKKYGKKNVNGLNCDRNYIHNLIISNLYKWQVER